MSREENVIPLRVAEILPEFSPDDLRLQIDVRLRLDDVAQAQSAKRDSQRAPTPADLCRLAGGIYDARRKRDGMLGGVLFGEPAWDMLLAL